MCGAVWCGVEASRREGERERERREAGQILYYIAVAAYCVLVTATNV